MQLEQEKLQKEETERLNGEASEVQIWREGIRGRANLLERKLKEDQEWEKYICTEIQVDRPDIN